MRKALVVGVVALCVLFGGIAVSGQDEWVPGLASFVLPGLGQLLNDQMDRAIIHFAVDVGIIALGYYAAALMPLGAVAFYAVPALHLGWAIYSGLDAYNVAKDQGFSIGFVENWIGLSYNF